MEIQNHLELIIDTLNKSIQNYDTVWYLNNPDSEEEFKAIDKSPFLKGTSYSLWKLCIIDLHKIFSESKHDQISLYNLFINIERKQYSSHQINKELLTKWRNDINTNKLSIDKVKFLRNKLYAHTDTNVKEDVDLYFREVQQLFEVAQRILTDFYSAAFETHLDHYRDPNYHNGQWDVKAMIKALKC